MQKLPNDQNDEWSVAPIFIGIPLRFTSEDAI